MTYDDNSAFANPQRRIGGEGVPADCRGPPQPRAQQTAETLAGAVCPDVTPTAGEGMNPNDDPRTIYDELTAARDQPGGLMLVGHLPHLARLAGLLLTGDADKAPVRFANAAVLRIAPGQTAWAVDWYLTPACVP